MKDQRNKTKSANNTLRKKWTEVKRTVGRWVGLCVGDCVGLYGKNSCGYDREGKR